MTCPICSGDCRALVSEWRGVTFTVPHCPLCANARVLVLLDGQRKRAAKPATGGN